MEAKYPKEAESPNTRNVSISELEEELEKLTQEVAEKKQKLYATFQHLHQMLVEREETLMAELDAIPTDISAKIEERRESLEQLTQHREETEKKLQANVLNDFLKQQLSGIQNQMEKILSDQIIFPRFSLSCHIKNIQKTLEDNCHIINTTKPYIFRTLPRRNEVHTDITDYILVDRGVFASGSGFTRPRVYSSDSIPSSYGRKKENFLENIIPAKDQPKDVLSHIKSKFGFKN